MRRIDEIRIDELINRTLQISECNNCGSVEYCGCDVVDIGSGLPKFSSDMNDAWRVVKVMRDRGLCGDFLISFGNEPNTYEAETTPTNSKASLFSCAIVQDKSPAMAICLAALQTLGVEVDEDGNVVRDSIKPNVLAKEAREWVASPEGQRQIQDAYDEAKRVTDALSPKPDPNVFM